MFFRKGDTMRISGLIGACVLVAATFGCAWFIPNPGRGADRFVNRADVQQRAGDLEGALLSINQALELKPDSKPILLRRASLRAQLKDTKRAREDLDRLIATDPKYGPAYVARGILRRKANDLDGSLEDLDKAVKLMPHMAHPFFARGSTRAAKGDMRGSIEDFTVAIDRDADFHRAYLWRAYAYIAADQPDRAMRDLLHVRKQTKDRFLKERADTLIRELALKKP